MITFNKQSEIEQYILIARFKNGKTRICRQYEIKENL